MLFGNMVVLIDNMDQAHDFYSAKMDLINEHMRYMKLPVYLQDDIRNYFEYLWIRHRSLIYGEEHIQDIGLGLQKKLLIIQYLPAFSKMPIFQTISSAYIEELIRKLRPKLFIPNVYITKEGNLGNEMYFIVKGKLSVIIEGLHINTLQDG